MQTATVINGTDSGNPYFVQLQRDGGWPLSTDAEHSLLAAAAAAEAEAEYLQT